MHLCIVVHKGQPGLTNQHNHKNRDNAHGQKFNRETSTQGRVLTVPDLLEYSLYYSVGEGVVAISDEVLLADQEVMVIIQFPELQGTQKFGSTSENATVSRTQLLLCHLST